MTEQTTQPNAEAEALARAELRALAVTLAPGSSLDAGDWLRVLVALDVRGKVAPGEQAKVVAEVLKAHRTDVRAERVTYMRRVNGRS